MPDRLLVMGWHNVAATYGFPARGEQAERGFESQMKSLARAANVIPLHEALSRLSAGQSLPRRAVAITFDDGYRDNLTLALPLLERLGLPATFFLVPELLSGNVDAWWETVGWALSASSRDTFSWEGMNFALDRSNGQSAYSPIVRALKRRNRDDRDRSMSELLELLAPPGEHKDPGVLLRRLAEIPIPNKRNCPRQMASLAILPFRDSSRWRYGTVIFKTCPIPFGGGPKPTFDT